MSEIAKVSLPGTSNQPRQDPPTTMLFPRVPLQQTPPHWLPHSLKIRLKQPCPKSSKFLPKGPDVRLSLMTSLLYLMRPLLYTHLALPRSPPITHTPPWTKRIHQIMSAIAKAFQPRTSNQPQQDLQLHTLLQKQVHHPYPLATFRIISSRSKPLQNDLQEISTPPTILQADARPVLTLSITPRRSRQYPSIRIK